MPNYVLHGFPTGHDVEVALNKGKTSVTEATVASMLTQKQNVLDVNQMKAVNSGITSQTVVDINTAVNDMNNKVLRYIPTGQALKYATKVTAEMDSGTYKISFQLWDQNNDKLGSPTVIDLPLDSVVVNAYYDNTNKQIILILQNGSRIAVPVSSLVNGLQPLITASNKLSADLVSDSSTTNKFMTPAQSTRLSQSVNKVRMDGVQNISGLVIEDYSGDRIINHSNTVNEVTNVSFRKLAYDNHGHVTGSSAVTKTDITNLVNGADIVLTGYSKASTVTPIDSDDTVNEAIGKLEKAIESASTGTVSSVAMTVPTGLQVSGTPITTTGTLAVTLQSGYTIPQTSVINSKISAKIDETDNEMLVLF